jgi:hypothetical protein
VLQGSVELEALNTERIGIVLCISTCFKMYCECSNSPICDDFELMQSHLKSYCPKLLVDHLHNSGTLGVGCSSGFGACLVLDICGFTTLTKDLSGQGSDGLVELHYMISNFLRHCVDIIHEFGGDGKSPVFVVTSTDFLQLCVLLAML